jgi:hypothetical protein
MEGCAAGKFGAELIVRAASLILLAQLRRSAFEPALPIIPDIDPTEFAAAVDTVNFIGGLPFGTHVIPVAGISFFSAISLYYLPPKETRT